MFHTGLSGGSKKDHHIKLYKDLVCWPYFHEIHLPFRRKVAGSSPVRLPESTEAGHWGVREQAIREITEYIEVFYNRQRRQARLGYLSPAIYKRQFYAG